MIAFIGSVFSPYYHWSGRGQPENHVALNIALYGVSRDSWAMTERGNAALTRTAERMRIGASSIAYADDRLEIEFEEVALPWPGHRAWPQRMSGRIIVEPQIQNSRIFDLDQNGHHIWWPVFPKARVKIECDHLPQGGWEGDAYHDFNFGDRILEKDFERWDWARGDAETAESVILYDAILRDGPRRRFGLSFSDTGAVREFEVPPRQQLPIGTWRVGGGIACDPDASPELLRKLEDAPFYRRSLVGTMVNGTPLQVVHETLDCDRLANPFVRTMLAFRMPRRTRPSKL